MKKYIETKDFILCLIASVLVEETINWFSGHPTPDLCHTRYNCLFIRQTENHSFQPD